ncbi:polygalacturonase inhibitor-like [Phoenix dactylifera]|uniref:Polygalacturonase inhibitor-like n=1 Tax=Phoenix dactylifera TaxID=42345 RepID=A0A8B7CV81_PHODC|nr:polygalacturonase inhibitor-like [Phoenix dactylifera]
MPGPQKIMKKMTAAGTLPPFLSLFFFILLLFSNPLPVSSVRCNKDDKKALLGIKAAFNNGDHFASWTEESSCCEWYSVICDAESGRVMELNIFDADFAGSIPAAIGDLSYIHSIVFYKLPNVVGPMPSALAKLKNLVYLTIRETNISGPVPDFLSELTALNQIDLSFNRLSGSIPSSLGDLHNLTSLDLSGNQLSGTIPPSLFQKITMKEPPSLRLSHNDLTGEIPPAFGKVGFFEIDLSQNRLTGDGSLLFGRSKPTSKIDLSRNQFEFDLTHVEFPEAINVVNLNENRIHGSIPAQITKLENLQHLNVSHNDLSGQIPSGGEMGRFDESRFLQNTRLCGKPLPLCK